MRCGRPKTASAAVSGANRGTFTSAEAIWPVPAASIAVEPSRPHGRPSYEKHFLCLFLHNVLINDVSETYDPPNFVGGDKVEFTGQLSNVHDCVRAGLASCKIVRS